MIFLLDCLTHLLLKVSIVLDFTRVSMSLCEREIRWYSVQEFLHVILYIHYPSWA
jgi:hypothetical protein